MVIRKSLSFTLLIATVAIVATTGCERVCTSCIPTAPTVVVVNQPTPTPVPTPTPTPTPVPTGSIPGAFDFINSQTTCAMSLNGGVAVLNWTSSVNSVHYYVESRAWTTGVWARQATVSGTSYTQQVGNVDGYYRPLAGGRSAS